MITKKLLSVLAFSLFSTTCFANECLDHLKDHLWGPILDFNSCQITDKDITAILKIANNNRHIQAIYLRDNKITDEGVSQLGLVNHSIDELGLAKNAIQGKTLASLKNLNPTSIFLEENPLENDSLKGLLLNNQLQALFISSDKFNDGIAKILSSHDFDALGIESNGISANEWENIGELSHVKYMIVGGNKLGNGFGEKISKNMFIEALEIKTNAMDANGFTQTFRNPHIQSFATSHIDDNSAFLEPLANSQYINNFVIDTEDNIVLNEHIGKYLSTNKSIMNMGIQSDITKGNYKIIVDVNFARAISTSNISNIGILGANINDDAAIVFAENNHLKSLDIEHGQITDSGATALAHSATLTELSLHGNQVTDSGALAFIDNIYLESLDLTKNPISYAAANKLKANSKIKDINIDLGK